MIYETNKQGVLKRSEKLEKQADKLENENVLAEKAVDSSDEENLEKKREKHERKMFHARRQKELEAE